MMESCMVNEWDMNIGEELQLREQNEQLPVTHKFQDGVIQISVSSPPY